MRRGGARDRAHRDRVQAAALPAAQRRAACCRKAQILDHVWNYDFGGDASVVETYISYLRKKVDADGPAADPHRPRRRLQRCGCRGAETLAMSLRTRLLLALVGLVAVGLVVAGVVDLPAAALVPAHARRPAARGARAGPRASTLLDSDELGCRATGRRAPGERPSCRRGDLRRPARRRRPPPAPRPASPSAYGADQRTAGAQRCPRPSSRSAAGPIDASRQRTSSPSLGRGGSGLQYRVLATLSRRPARHRSSSPIPLTRRRRRRCTACCSSSSS